MAEEYVNRLRFAEIGIHHGAGSHFSRWPEKASWREERRCAWNGDPLIRWDWENVDRRERGGLHLQLIHARSRSLLSQSALEHREDTALAAGLLRRKGYWCEL